MRYIFLAFLSLGFFQLFGQAGNYFLSHFSPAENRYDNVCFDMVQSGEGLMFFATRNGVLEFDGRNWTLIAGKGAVYSLQLTKEGTIVWAGAQGFGLVEHGADGPSQLTTLSDAGVTDVFQALAIDDKRYFISEKALYVFAKDATKPVVINAPEFTGAFVGMVEMFGGVYVNTERGGILKLDKNTLTKATLGFADSDEILFATVLDNNYLIGLASNKIYVCGENLRPREITLNDAAYISGSVVVNGGWVNRDLIVLGTLRGGMIFINPATGKTQQIVNYTTGLPDNEVYALMSDKSQHIWAAHEYGFTRVSPYLPFRSFSHYTGLQGNLLCALSLENQLYVGTSLGLYTLEREEVYDEITHYTYEPIAQSIQPAKTETSTTAETVTPETQSKKKGFLRFLKRNQKSTGEAKQPAASPAATAAAPKTTDARQYKRVKKTERFLRHTQYVYKKVNGIDAKISQLCEADGELIAAGLGGAFKIDGLQAQPLLDEPVRMAHYVASEKLLLLSTHKDEMKALALTPTGWKPSSILDDLDEPINFMFAGQDGELWLCGLQNVIRLDLKQQAVAGMQIIPLANPNFDEIAGLRIRNDIVVLNSLGWFRFDRTKKVFQAIDTLAAPLQYFAEDGLVVYRDAHRWNAFGEQAGQNLRLLNLHGDLRFISGDETGESFWLITGSNELYWFDADRFTPYEVGHPLILKEVRNSSKRVSRKGMLQFDEDKSAITFDLIQPDYLASPAIEYRYQVKGLDKTWSEWSAAANTIDFPYLPSGDYTLLAQSKDIFGTVKDLAPVSFEVLPPYWKRPWFYALELVLFAGLVLLSFRLSTRYQLISRLLALLTIILLIQFIQTAIGEYFQTKASPVTDFFVQVVVAFMVLPVEGYLRKLMLRSLGSDSVFRQFIMPKLKPSAGDKERQH